MVQPISSVTDDENKILEQILEQQRQDDLAARGMALPTPTTAVPDQAVNASAAAGSSAPVSGTDATSTSYRIKGVADNPADMLAKLQNGETARNQRGGHHGVKGHGAKGSGHRHHIKKPDDDDSNLTNSSTSPNTTSVADDNDDPTKRVIDAAATENSKKENSIT